MLEIPNFPYTAKLNICRQQPDSIPNMTIFAYLKRKWRNFYPWLKVAVLVLLLALVLKKGEGPPRYEVTGQARLVDGDSLFIDGLEIRMKNIDAPEGRQNCQRRGRDWRCGIEATRRLRQFINKRQVSCKGDEYDRYNRLLAFCTVAGQELNKWMVRKGWAVSFGGYRQEEQTAKREHKGIWSSRFQRPKIWRNEQRR